MSCGCRATPCNCDCVTTYPEGEAPGDIVHHIGNWTSATNIEIAVQVPPPAYPCNSAGIRRIDDRAFDHSDNP